MGTKVAPSYANLLMADFEDKFVYTYPDQPFLWLRFIDDMFMMDAWNTEPGQLHCPSQQMSPLH